MVNETISDPSTNATFVPTTSPSPTQEPTQPPTTTWNETLNETVDNVAVSFLQASASNTFPNLDSASLAALYAKMSDYGIWYWVAYKPNKAHKGIYPGLKGSLIIYRWSQLEPSQGVYDWTQVDSYMAAANAEGLNYGFTFLVGPDSPGWLYKEGVPEVKTTNTGFDRFPYYFHPLYLESFAKAEQEVISYLMNLPAEWANSLVEVKLNDGSTGDPYCYKGDLLSAYKQYSISEDAWDAFRRENIQSVHDYLGTEGLATLEMAFTHMTNETEAFTKALFPKVKFFKNGMASHGYHIPEDEATVLNVQRSQAFDGDASLGGTRIRWFGEMDHEWTHEWFQKSTTESFWWSAIYALHMGLSRWFIDGDAMAMPEHHFVSLSLVLALCHHLMWHLTVMKFAILFTGP